MKKILCADCYFFAPAGASLDLKTGARLLSTDPKAPQIGACMRFPPQLLSPTQASFSVTQATSWCGEAKARE